MKKITLLIALMLTFVTGSYAQSASSYTFASSSGVYADNSGAATLLPLVRADTYISPAQNIGFNFVYEGVTYTQFKMSSNGFISLNMTGTSSLTANDFSTANTASRPIIAPLWDDLDGATPATSIASYELTGTAPNQVLTVEWKNWEWNWNSGATPVISFQVKLYESTNVIEFIYRQEATAVATGSASIGIGSATGSGAGSYLNVTNVAAPAVSSTVSTTNINTKPATGQIFRFSPPPVCSGTPTGGTSAPALTNVCTGVVPASINVTGSTAATGLTYQWEESTNGGGSWANATGGTGATTLSYTPPAFAGTDIQYRLKITCTGSGLFAYSTVAEVKSVIAPATQASALNFTNTLYTNVTANWTNGNGGRRLVIVSDSPTITDPVNASGQPAVVANAVYAGTGEQIVYDGTGTTVNVFGLNCNTTYYFKVYDYVRCGSGPYDFYYNVSTGTNASSVTTLQPSTATLPVANSFTGFTGANLSTVFPGWYESTIVTPAASIPSNSFPGTSASAWTSSSALGVPTAKVNLYLSTRNEWIISPKITLTANSRTRFKAAITDFASGAADATGITGTDDKVDVMISTDGCGSSWTVLYTFDATTAATLSNVLKDYTIDLSVYTGQTVQLAFRATDGPVDNTPDYDFHVTNINIELIPTCEPPTALGVNNITADSADLFWTAGGTETLWNVEYGVTGFVQGTGTPATGVTNPFSVGSLTPNTTYQYYVQADCGGTGTSTWAGPFSFTTPCVAYSIPYFEGFESGYTHNVAVAGCLSQASVTGTASWTANSSLTSYNRAPRTGTWNAFLQYSNEDWLFIPINLTAGTSYTVSLYARQDDVTAADSNIAVSYGTSASAAGMTDVIVPATGIVNGSYQQIAGAFIPSTTGVYYVGIKGFMNVNPWYISLDDISIDVTPACAPPLGLSANSVTSSSAALTWTATTGNYQYVLDNSASDPAGAGTNLSGEVFNAASLSPVTTYYFHVRTDCGGTYSAWSTVSFTTLAVPPVNDDCANATALTPGGVYATNPIDGTNAGATTSSQTAPVTCFGFSGNDVWYSVVVPASGNITIETGAPVVGGAGIDTVITAYSGDCTTPTQIGCDDDSATETAVGFSKLSLTGQVPGSTILIRAYEYGNDVSGNFGISAYDASLSTGSFDAASFKVYPNPVKDVLNLSYSSEITSVEVFNMLGQKVLVKELNVAQGQIDMSNLNSGNYIVKVTADGLTKTIKVIKE